MLGRIGVAALRFRRSAERELQEEEDFGARSGRAARPERVRVDRRKVRARNILQARPGKNRGQTVDGIRQPSTQKTDGRVLGRRWKKAQLSLSSDQNEKLDLVGV